MARFFTGGIEDRVRPASPIGESRMGGLGPPPAIITPAQSQATARALRNAIARRMEATDFFRLTNKQQNLIIKALIAALTPRELGLAVNDLSQPISNDYGKVVGQEGYTLQWSNQEYLCSGGWSGEYWFDETVSPGFAHKCLGFGSLFRTMSENLLNLPWKHEIKRTGFGPGFGGTVTKGFFRTGTVGVDIKTRVLPRSVDSRNKIVKTITALNPWSNKLELNSDTRQIPEKLMDLADKLAEKEEPFAEARSRQEGDPFGDITPQTTTEFSFGRGVPRKVKVKTKFPEPFKGKEQKHVAGIAAGSILGRLLNGVTESLDVFNVAYDALDASLKPRGRTSQLQRIELVITNIASLDVDKLIEGLIANEVEDRIIGSISGAAARATAKATGKPIAGFIGTSRGAALRAGS